MKKILLSILTITTLGASAQNVNFTSPTFKNYCVANTNINTNLDTEIQISEAIAFTFPLILNGLNISDLTGIEEFHYITSLTITNNSSITTVDLSQNWDLTSVTLTDNVSLTNVDLSANILVNYVKIENCAVSTLNLPQNNTVTTLFLSNNSLTSLNLSQNAALTSLNCSYNSITSLDVSQNLNLQTLYCHNNLLTTLDISLNLLISDLYCDNNQLTYLNAANGNNNNFFDFQAFLNPSLTCIQVDNVAYSTTNWTSIDAGASFSTQCVTTGINETSNNLELTTYPNPTTGKVTFTSRLLLSQNVLSDQLRSIEIYNITGQNVATFNNTNTIDIRNLPSGMYTAKVIAEQQVDVVRLIKE